MKTNYTPSLSTCVLSGTFLCVTLLIPVMVYAITSTLLFAGITLLAVGAFLYGKSLTRAGFDIIRVQLSHFSAFSRMALITTAVVIAAILYVSLSLLWIDSFEYFDLARLMSALLTVAFFPALFYVVSAPFTK